MEKHVPKSRFKPHALRYFREIEETGEAIVITDHGRPVLRIAPIVEDVESALAFFRGSVVRYTDPLEPVGTDDWEALR